MLQTTRRLSCVRWAAPPPRAEAVAYPCTVVSLRPSGWGAESGVRQRRVGIRSVDMFGPPPKVCEWNMLRSACGWSLGLWMWAKIGLKMSLRDDMPRLGTFLLRPIGNSVRAYAPTLLVTVLSYPAIRALVATGLVGRHSAWVCVCAMIPIWAPVDWWIRSVRIELKAHSICWRDRGWLGRARTIPYSALGEIRFLPEPLRLEISTNSGETFRIGPWGPRRRRSFDARIRDVISAIEYAKSDALERE